MTSETTPCPERVRVRFAPSPTGYLHLGGARTALYDWLYARHCDGSFILRIEDTDRKRYVPDSVQDIMDGLRWLGLDWDEGPDVGGEYGPYIQSQRLDLYQKWAHWLVDEGKAYKCFCTPEELAQMRKEQQARGEPPRYDRRCRYLTPEEVAQREAEGRPYVIRFKTPLEGKVVAYDLLRGLIEVDASTLDDFILLKSDGYPTYHLAVVVDDHFMEISHVLRGEEWIPSLPKHRLLYDAFGWEMPLHCHLPVILDPSGKGKMSKRRAEKSGLPILIRDFREQGYLPEAMFNWLARIGWSYDPEVEIFSREEAIAHFDLKDINPKPAAAPYSKLDWLNGVYIRRLSVDELLERLLPFLSRDLDIPEDTLRSDERLRRLLPSVQERIKRLTEATPLVDFLYREPEYEPAMLIARKTTAAETLAALQAARDVIAQTPFEADALEKALRDLAAQMGLKAGQVFAPIRVALTGKKVAPPLFDIILALGREETLRRLDKAIALLRQWDEEGQ
ncbi:MAG: glutamate--tRNA ligase [Chloroflexi bacterium]|nr:glutamate--tRNA ligase [Chloroflexota bacterium]